MSQMCFRFQTTRVISTDPEKRIFINYPGGHDRGEKPEFTSLLRSDTPNAL